MTDQQALDILRENHVQIPPTYPVATPMTQHGDNNTQIGSVDNFHLTVYNNASHIQPAQHIALRTDFYQLFVIKGFNHELPCLSLDPQRALTEDMSPKAPQGVKSLTPQAIKQLKEYPALFMDENEEEDKPNLTQLAWLGRVTEIHLAAQIQVFYELVRPIQQQVIHDLAHALHIVRLERGGELRRTHWTLKQVDLWNVLRSTGHLSENLSRKEES